MRRKLTVLAAALTLAAGPGAAFAATGPGAAGAGWTIQHVPLPAGADNASPSAVSCPSASDCVLVGFYVKPSVGGLPLAENWNGHAWSAQTVPSPSGGQWTELQALSCASATQCVAVGEDQQGTSLTGSMVAEQRNGSTWTAQTSFPLPSGGQGQFLQGVWCLTASSCTAVGTYYPKSGGGSRYPVAEHWNGHAWAYQVVPDPGKSQNSYLNGITCTSADNCLAVGYYLTTGAGVGKPVTAQWNGHAWTLLTTPLPAAATNGGWLSSVSCSSATDCTAVGLYLNKKTEGAYTLGERWNGSSWTIQPTPSPSTISPIGDGLNDVWCLSATSCTAVGFADGSGNLSGTKSHSRPLAEHWNGTAWSVQQTAEPKANQSLDGLACASASTCTAVGGSSDNAGRTAQPVAERN
jgi:hypothetical protein